MKRFTLFALLTLMLAFSAQAQPTATNKARTTTASKARTTTASKAKSYPLNGRWVADMLRYMENGDNTEYTKANIEFAFACTDSIYYLAMTLKAEIKVYYEDCTIDVGLSATKAAEYDPENGVTSISDLPLVDITKFNVKLSPELKKSLTEKGVTEADLKKHLEDEMDWTECSAACSDLISHFSGKVKSVTANTLVWEFFDGGETFTFTRAKDTAKMGSKGNSKSNAVSTKTNPTNEKKTEEVKPNKVASNTSSASTSSNQGTSSNLATSSTAVSNSDTNEVLTTTDQMPTFNGNLQRWLSNNLNYPNDAYNARVQGRVICSFIVEKDGSVSSITVEKGISPSLDAEACRVIRAMPKWNPGKKNGEAVRVKFNLPISFKL